MKRIKTDIRKRIESLGCSINVKESLKEILCATKSDEESIKNLIPHILLFCDKGCNYRTVAELYADIIESGNVISNPSKLSLNELDILPDMDKNCINIAFQEFIDKEPYQNRYKGTALINMKNWADKHREYESFSTLVNFIIENKDYLKYIFVFAETEDKNQRIIDELKKYLLLETLHIRQPQNEELIPYLSTKLKEKKLLLDEIEFVKCIKDIDLTFQYGSYEKIEFLVNKLDYYRYVKGYNHDLFTSVIEELQTKTDRKNNRIGF